MKIVIRWILVGMVFALWTTCAMQRSLTYFIGHWHEKTLAFSESISYQDSNDLLVRITAEKWCCSRRENYQWLRKNNNLQTTFNVLKKVGIRRLLSSEDYNKTLFENIHWDYDWEGMSLNDVVKKMMDSYGVEKDTSNYYYKFWKRREVEGNAHVVMSILQQVDRMYNNNELPLIDQEFLNEELYDLLHYNVEINACDSTKLKEKTLEYFNYLKQVGLEHSAYNLIFELEKTQSLVINKDSLLLTLHFDTVPEDAYWENRNNAQWIKTYRDNGP